MNLLTRTLFDHLIFTKGLQGTHTARMIKNSLIAEQRIIDEAEKKHDCLAVEAHKKLISRRIQTLELM